MPVQCIRSPDPEGERLAFITGCRQLGFGEVLAAWRDEPSIRDMTLAALAATPHPAIFWEMPRLDADSLGRPYEGMILRAMGLDTIEPDPRAFADKFVVQSNETVAVFDNLGGDATLIAPRPEAARSAYGHLAAFVRAAPRGQAHALLRTVAETALARVGRRPLWISTSGLGVPWLHVRLDQRPKYYACRRYRVLAEDLVPKS